MGQVNSRLTAGDFMILCQLSGGCQFALGKQQSHLNSRSLWCLVYEIMMAYGLMDLCQKSSCIGQFSPGQFQADKKQFAFYEYVIMLFIWLRFLEGFFSMMLRSIQIIPFIPNTGQTKMHMDCNRNRQVTNHFQNMFVGFSRLMQLIFRKLYVAQTGSSQYLGIEIPRRLANCYRFGKGLTSSSSISLKFIGSA